MIQNTLLRAVNTISGCYGAANDTGNLMDIEELYNLESDLGDSKEARKTRKAEM